jgi:biotin carboxylase
MDVIAEHIQTTDQLKNTSVPRQRAAASDLALGDVVLVNPAMTGRGFKAACRERGLRVVSLYTIPGQLLETFDPDYAAGDDLALHAPDLPSARKLLVDPVRAVIPTTEPSVLIADQLGAEFGVPGNPVETALARRDKTAMRRHAAATGIRVPAFAVVDSGGIATAAARIGYPAILKPATGAGSNGVSILSDANAAQAMSASMPASHDMFGNPLREWVVEEYVRGRELAVNAFSVDGIHRVLDIWEYRQPSTHDYDQPYWDVVQLQPDDPDWQQAARFVHRVLDAYRVNLGPSHTEIKVRPDGPCLIELASRLPGIHMTDHWTAHSTIRPYADTLAAYLGEDPGLLQRDLGFDAALGVCCIRNDDRPGTLVAIEGLAELHRMPGVDGIFTDLKPGDHVPLTRDLGTLAAAIMVSGPDPTTLNERLSDIRTLVKLELT